MADAYVERRGDVVTITEDGVATQFRRVKPTTLPLILRARRAIERVAAKVPYSRQVAHKVNSAK